MIVSSSEIPRTPGRKVSRLYLTKSWQVYNRDPHTVLPFVVLILGKQQTWTNPFKYASVNSDNRARRMQVQYSLFHIMTLSGAFRHFQTLSNSQWCNPHRQIKPIVVSMLECNYDSLQCCATRTEDSSYTVNVVFWERKSACTSCTYNSSRGWVCWLLWGALTRETITWKSYQEVKTTSTTKMATTLDHVTGAWLSWTNK